MVEARLSQEKAGTVKIWNGLVSQIPSGWALCDGSNGTPDLRGKFVKGAQSGDEGGSGGSTTYTHTGLVVDAHAGVANLRTGGAAIGFADDAARSHNVTPPSDHVNVEPPFYKLCYIMKL